MIPGSPSFAPAQPHPPAAAPILLAGLAFLAAVGAGRGLAALAGRLGMVDQPGPRKVHARATPRTGGLAILAGALLALLVGVALGWTRLPRWPWPTWLAGAGFLATGVLDDRYQWHPRHKLPVFLAWSILAAQPWVRLCAAPEHRIHLGPWAGHLAPGLAWPLLALWFLAVTNALNIEDAINGHMGGFTLVILGVAAAAGLDCGILAGAVAGFLVLNWPRATHFLGDGGSYGCGFLVAELVLRAGGAGHPLRALILTAPLSMDVAMGLARRARQGIGLLVPDRATLPHHVLAALGRAGFLAAPLLWANALACAALARRPSLAAAYLALFALVLVAFNWPVLTARPGREGAP